MSVTHSNTQFVSPVNPSSCPPGGCGLLILGSTEGLLTASSLGIHVQVSCNVRFGLHLSFCTCTRPAPLPLPHLAMQPRLLFSAFLLHVLTALPPLLESCLAFYLQPLHINTCILKLRSWGLHMRKNVWCFSYSPGPSSVLQTVCFHCCVWLSDSLCFHYPMYLSGPFGRFHL